jgi:RNA polymerase sigma-70 factor (ECF subfamily)
LFGISKRKQFETLFLPHLDAAYNLARYMSGSPVDAEDIVQEAYLKAYRAFGSYTDENSRAWILTITRNTSRSWLRRHHQVDISFDEKINSMEMAAPLSDSAIGHSPDQMTEIIYNQQQIRNAIELLPVEFREVAILRELEELTYQEIGLVLDIPIGTVMSRIARARNRLRQLLDRNAHEYTER